MDTNRFTAVVRDSKPKELLDHRNDFFYLKPLLPLINTSISNLYGPRGAINCLNFVYSHYIYTYTLHTVISFPFSIISDRFVKEN